jgi:hypothetical protein
MKRSILFFTILIGLNKLIFAQGAPANVSKVVDAEKNFNTLVEQKGIKGGFLEVADPDGIVFKPDIVKITDFYNNIAKQPGSLSWQPQLGRISIAGDLAFTAGPYVYQNGAADTDKVYGDYVSVWRSDPEGKLKLLIDLGIQHPEPETKLAPDFKSPDTANRGMQSKDFFGGKKVIMNTDNSFNYSLSLSTISSYNEFLSLNGHYYFPGFDPISGRQSVMKFIANEAISITAETTSGGRSTSNDLAYTYGKARIKKGEVVGNYYYVRIWEIDETKKWNILLEVFSAVENE